MPEFKVLKGGLSQDPKYKFIDAYVTDTRLMGALGLRVHWNKIDSNEDSFDIYHFYYFDVEELGLDFLRIFELADEEAIELATRSCFGGLGANLMAVSERQARYLINYFIDDTIAKKEKLPDTLRQAYFVREERPVLSEEELLNLNNIMCTGLATDYAVVHYFLMRNFGKDIEGRNLLLKDGKVTDMIGDISSKEAATFLQNTIEEYLNPDGSISYLSESLIQAVDGYYIITSEIKVAGKKVIFAKKNKEFKITIEEASMILSRGEYVSAYKILVPIDDFEVDFTSFSIGTTKTEHESGNLYMDFNPDNNHVEEKIFRLNGDLHSLFFVSDDDDFLVATYSLDDMISIEKMISLSPICSDVFMVGRMQFPSEMVYEFAQSGIPSFEDFIQALHLGE